MCSAVMLLLDLMCSAVMIVAGINVFCCDDCAEIDAADLCEPAAAIWYSLPICVLRSEILFRCCSWTSCSEVIFAAELCVVRCAAKLWRQQRCSSLCRTGSLRRTSSRCRIGQPAANQFSLPIPTISLLGSNDLNANNNFMIWWCKIGNTWMWTYELLK